MSELQKIGPACFIGAVVCGATSVIIGPLAFSTNLLAGIVIGAFTGYLCYDLREVWLAIPRAWQQMKQSTSKFSSWIVDVPHPALFSGLFAGLLFVLWISTILPAIPKGGAMWGVSVMGLIVLMMSMLVAYVLIQALINVGADTLGYHRRNIDRRFFCWTLGQKFPFQKKRFGRKIDITYTSATLLFFLGVMTIIPWAVLFLLVGVSMLLERAAKFLWNILKLVHSNNRIICAIDGPLGGCVAYLLIPGNAIVDTVVTYVLLGGVLGALIGIANKALIAKRLLKIA